MLFIILSLLFLGLMLMVVEVVFIPGTTFVGLLGIIFSIAGVVVSYNAYGNDIGFYALIGTASVNLLAFIVALRAEVWTRFALKTSITAKVNQHIPRIVNIGDIGRAVSTLRPMGKANINDHEFEVKSLSGYVKNGSTLRVVEVNTQQIIVEPTN